MEKNDTLAAKWFAEAAMRGDPLAQDRLARLYFLGQGVTRDITAALLWQTLAEEGGVTDETLKNAMEPDITPEIRAKVAAEIEKLEAAAGSSAP